MISEEKWSRFFAVFAESGVIKTACKAADIHRDTVHAHKTAGESPDATPEQKAWLKRYKEAELDAGDVVEQEMYRRAIEGVDEPLIGRIGKDQDGIITTVKRFSDALLVRLAQARRPEKFKDKVAQEVSGPGGGPVQTESKVIVMPAIPDDSPE